MTDDEIKKRLIKQLDQSRILTPAYTVKDAEYIEGRNDGYAQGYAAGLKEVMRSALQYGEPMTPSKEAIEAAYQRWSQFRLEKFFKDSDGMEPCLRAAYAIDFAALQQENERLKAEAETRSDLLVGKIAALERQHTLLRELAEALKLGIGEGELQTYASRERFRAKARAALARAEEVLK